MKTLKKSRIFKFFMAAALAAGFASCSKNVAYNPIAEPKSAQYVLTKPVQTPETTADANTVLQEKKDVALAEVSATKQEKTAYKHPKKNASNLLAKTINKAKNADTKEIAAKVTQVLPVFASAEKSKKATMLDRNLKLAIIFIVIGAIVGWLLGGFFGLFQIVGAILVLIGLIFLLLWVLSL